MKKEYTNKTSQITLLLLLASAAATSVFAQTAKPVQSKVYDVQNKTSKIYTTADNSDLRLSENGTLNFKEMKQPLETQICVFVDPELKFQSFLGIGGAITDATAETYAKLSKETQKEFLTAYYDRNKGIGYSLARTSINSTDFSSDTYNYVKDNDAALTSFNVAHDEKYRIPLIKQAIAAAGNKLPLFVSPWSPPAWMKTNNSMLKGGKLKPEFRQAWANYYVKFIKTYEKMGMPIWGLTVQNEPMATQTWESCVFTAEEERDFIKTYLGPTLQKGGLGDKKLIAWDHNRDQVFQRASVILSDPEAAKYVWGIGFHWYETWTGSTMQFDNVKMVHDSYPKVNLLLTEASIEKYNPDSLKSWALGERYGNSIINDLNSGAKGWTDWNMLLDEHGGPNHVGNFCFAPIHADSKTGKLIYTNSYYYLGHFSKFIRPGAERVATASNRDKLISTSFLNTNGELVVVVMNKSGDKLAYNIWIHGKAAETTSLPHSISTYVIK
jgi:glucosylceramidase